MRGAHAYSYCLVPSDAEDHALASAGRLVSEFLSPARVVRGDGRPRSYVAMPREGQVQLSALRSSGADALVVRVYTPRDEAAETTLRFWRDVGTARAVDLREGDAVLGNTGLDVIRTAAPPDVVDGVLRVSLAGYEIGTYLVQLVA